MRKDGGSECQVQKLAWFSMGDSKNEVMSLQKSRDELLLPQVDFMLKVSPASPAPVGGK